MLPVREFSGAVPEWAGPPGGRMHDQIQALDDGVPVRF